jgi:hypothetical protein
MANGLLSIQDLAAPTFRKFRTSAIDVVAGPRTHAVVRELLNEKPLLVESMFFESTFVGTPLHADGDYMDSEARGTMVRRLVRTSRLLKNVFRGVKQPLRFLFVPVRIQNCSRV